MVFGVFWGSHRPEEAGRLPGERASGTFQGRMTLEEILERKRERVADFHRFERGRTALLVIDMQRGFLEKGASLEVPPGRAIIPIVKELIDTARQSRVPAIFSQFV